MDVGLQIKQEPEQREESNNSFTRPLQSFSTIHAASAGGLNYGANNPAATQANYNRPVDRSVPHGAGHNRPSVQANVPEVSYVSGDLLDHAQAFNNDQAFNDDQSSRLQAFYNEQLSRLQAYYRPGENGNLPQGFFNQQLNQQVFDKFVAKAPRASEATSRKDTSAAAKYNEFSEDADPLDMSINTAAFCEAVIETQSVKREVEVAAAAEKRNPSSRIANRTGFELTPIAATPSKTSKSQGTTSSAMMPQPRPTMTSQPRPSRPASSPVAVASRPRPPAEKTHLCTVCNARFTQSSHLNTHRRQHTGEKPYACESCPARFNQSAHLTTHRRKHTGERPYVCDQCPANFTQSDSLTKHKRQHTGEKPYPCQQCDARFTQPSSLTRHNRLHAGEKPYACNECEARFNTSSHLTRHRLQHTGEKPYACTDCEARFTQRIHLITHRRQHTGEKPFACTECSARFAQKSNLVSHKRTHTGFKPHQCSRCLKRFARLSYVKLHAQTCHSAPRGDVVPSLPSLPSLQLQAASLPSLPSLQTACHDAARLSALQAIAAVDPRAARDNYVAVEEARIGNNAPSLR